MRDAVDQDTPRGHVYQLSDDVVQDDTNIKWCNLNHAGPMLKTMVGRNRTSSTNASSEIVTAVHTTEDRPAA